MTPRLPLSERGSNSVIRAAHRRSTLKVPIRFTLMTCWKRSRSCGPSRPTILDAGAIPAQLTAIRGAPHSFTICCRAASTDSALETSASSAHPPISLAVFWAPSMSQSSTATRAPRPDNICAVTAPMPEPPPVTSAGRFSRFINLPLCVLLTVQPYRVRPCLFPCIIHDRDPEKRIREPRQR